MQRTVERNVAEALNQDIQHTNNEPTMISFHANSRNEESFRKQASMAYAALRGTSKDSGYARPFREMKENTNINNVSISRDSVDMRRDSINRGSINSRQSRSPSK